MGLTNPVTANVTLQTLFSSMWKALTFAEYFSWSGGCYATCTECAAKLTCVVEHVSIKSGKLDKQEQPLTAMRCYQYVSSGMLAV